MLIPSFNCEIIHYIKKIFLVFWFQIIQSRDIVHTAKHLFFLGAPGDCLQRPWHSSFLKIKNIRIKFKVTIISTTIFKLFDWNLYLAFFLKNRFLWPKCVSPFNVSSVSFLYYIFTLNHALCSIPLWVA